MESICSEIIIWVERIWEPKEPSEITILLMQDNMEKGFLYVGSQAVSMSAETKNNWGNVVKERCTCQKAFI